LRAQLGIEREAGPVILTVGRLIPKKQPLREAFRQVRASRRCTLFVVGSGQFEHELRQKVAAEGIPDVVFAGFLDQTQVARAYAAADVFALSSSHDETWGLVVNEAMNFGLPIVVSDRVGCGADLVENRRNGFIVPWRDREALARALQTLVESAALRQRFGQASIEVISPWTYDRAAAGLCHAVAAAVGAERWSHAG
jgi:glycosyltransferase involved in cell wall biosynthesis